jgi:hypothetical protein
MSSARSPSPFFPHPCLCLSHLFSCIPPCDHTARRPLPDATFYIGLPSLQNWKIHRCTTLPLSLPSFLWCSVTATQNWSETGSVAMWQHKLCLHVLLIKHKQHWRYIRILFSFGGTSLLWFVTNILVNAFCFSCLTL